MDSQTTRQSMTNNNTKAVEVANIETGETETGESKIDREQEVGDIQTG